MPEKKPERDDKKDPGSELSMDVVMRHPAVQKITTELQQMRSIVEALPEAIGRAVSEALRNRPPAGASGSPIPLKGGFAEFSPGSSVRIGGSQEEATPEGLYQMLCSVGVSSLELKDVKAWGPARRKEAFTWARLTFLAKGKGPKAKGIEVPPKPTFIE